MPTGREGSSPSLVIEGKKNQSLRGCWKHRWSSEGRRAGFDSLTRYCQEVFAWRVIAGVLGHRGVFEARRAGFDSLARHGSRRIPNACPGGETDIMAPSEGAGPGSIPGRGNFI